MTTWQSVVNELSWSMERAEYQRLSGSALTVSNGLAIVTVASEDAARWLQAHMSFVIRRRLIANGIICERVTIEY